MYRQHARLTRLQDHYDPLPKRRPDPAIVGTPRERDYLKARTDVELEMMEAGLLHLQAGGELETLDAETYALMTGWYDAKLADEPTEGRVHR